MELGPSNFNEHRPQYLWASPRKIIQFGQWFGWAVSQGFDCNSWWSEGLLLTQRATICQAHWLIDHFTDYGPIVIGIETPRKFQCMFPDSRSITHASFMGVWQFFWAQWVVEGWKVIFSLLWRDHYGKSIWASTTRHWLRAHSNSYQNSPKISVHVAR